MKKFTNLTPSELVNEINITKRFITACNCYRNFTSKYYYNTKKLENLKSIYSSKIKAVI